MEAESALAVAAALDLVCAAAAALVEAAGPLLPVLALVSAANWLVSSAQVDRAASGRAWLASHEMMTRWSAVSTKEPQYYCLRSVHL